MTPNTPPPARPRPLRVLQIIDELSLAGGAQRQLLEVCRRLPRDRFEVEVVELRGDGGLRPQFRDLGLPLHDHTPKAWDPLGTVRTTRLVRRRGFDLVHAHRPRAELVARQAVRSALPSTPLLLHKYRVDDLWKRPLYASAHRWITARAQAIVVPSERLAVFYREPAFQVADPSVLRVIPFGRVSGEPPPIPAARATARGELGLADETPLVLAAGRLVDQKRHDLLLEAFAHLRRRQPDAHLVIAGSGELEDELEARAEGDDLAGFVHFVGFRADLMTWLAGADLFVNSSDWEGLPLVLLDAMAAGVPMVATAVAAVPDCVIDGETGRLVPAGDIGALATALIEGLEERDRAGRWAAAAEQRVAEVFDIDGAARGWEVLYDEMTVSRRATISTANSS